MVFLSVKYYLVVLHIHTLLTFFLTALFHAHHEFLY